MITPSFKSGFARSQGESSNPGLWRGLISALAPGLGSTGNKVRNFAGGPDFTLGGAFTLADDWGPDRGEWNLGFNGTSTYSVSGTFNHNIGTGDFTYACRVRKTGSPNSYSGVYSNGTFAPAIYTVMDGDEWGVWHNGSLRTNSTLDVGPWYSLVACRRNGVFYMYENAALIHTETKTTSISNATQVLGSSKTSSNEFAGNLAAFYFYNRAITDTEVQELHLDPLAPFQLAQSSLGLAPSGGGGPTVPIMTMHYKKLRVA